MKLNHFFLAAAFSLTTLVACKKEQKRGSIDYTEVKTELQLDQAKEKQFDEITAKYKKMQQDNYENAKAQGNMDRVALGIKNEELRKSQSEEMAKILSPEQLQKFNTFVDQKSRKRPRYDDELLAKIKTEAALDEKQFDMLNAANNAFEKAFSDAHDIYHGNTELAKEYWVKFDNQRKAAVKTVLSPEQNAKFLEIVKDQQFKGRE
ncbi:MAG: hypothetical protein KA289_00280 [Kaistella sp.]|nr:hypothetical protein [Kaistella sp.]